MILYLDTLALLYRAYHAIPDLAAKDGTPTGALYGLTNTLFKSISAVNPDHVIACFDRPEQTLRQQEHEEYKAHRETPEEDMIAQIEIARSMLSSFGVHVVEKAGYEADDLLGTLAVRDSGNGEKAVILSCDGDLLQLTVHPGVSVCLLSKGMSGLVQYDRKKVEEKNGYPAEYIIDFKGLAGDSSDNITGVPGIGAVFAKRLITSFGSLDGVYNALDEGALPDAGFTKRIEKLLTDGRESAFVSRDLATIHIDVPVDSPHTVSEPWQNRVVRSDALDTLERYGLVSLIPRLDELIGTPEDGGAAAVAEDPAVEREAVIALWVLDANRTNATPEEVKLYTRTETIDEALDVLLERLRVAGLLSVWNTIEKPLIPIIASMEDIGITFDTASAERLSGVYREKLTRLTEEIHAHAGREFNIKSPKQLSEVLYGDLGLHPGRQLKTTSRGKTTKEEVLREMIDDHPIINLILQYRHYEKLRSSYTDALTEFVDSSGRIHTQLEQNGTATGRLSSHSPNLQNIPTEDKDGTGIRNLFTATDGWVMVSVDYSQLELRIVSILSEEKEMLRVFKEEKDVHISTAARIFSVPERAVTSKQRNHAKSINFGILYGMGPQALGKSTGIPRQEAEQFLSEYRKMFPNLFVYFDLVKKEARVSGGVTTAFGRFRPIEGITSSLSFVRSQAERMAVNSVVQGTGADIIKIAMVNIDTMLREKGFSSEVRMMLQIHDELLFEVRPEAMERIIPPIVHCMESVYPPDRNPVPLVVTVKQGSAWGSLEPYPHPVVSHL